MGSEMCIRDSISACLRCFDVIREDAIILFHDFLPRRDYHAVLDWFEIVDKTSAHNLVALQKRSVGSPTPLQLKTYEDQPR